MGHRDQHHTRDRSTTPLSRWWYRAVVAGAVLLWAQGVSVAQLPMAPPPRPCLDDLVKEYRRLGLPLPPPGADLVRLDWSRTTAEPGDWDYKRFFLGFRLLRAKPGEMRQLVGAGGWESYVFFDPRDIEVIEPNPEMLAGLELWYPALLCLAIQCKARGWDDFASALSARAQEVWLQGQDKDDDKAFAPVAILRELAFHRAYQQLWEKDTDRKQVLQRLKDLANEEATLRTPENLDLFRRLELTLAPRTSKPGTADALIDDLIDHWVDADAGFREKRADESYWKLVDLGFDAVPALIRHLDDERLTRSRARWQGGIPARWGLEIRVSQLVGQVLNRLSDGAIQGSPPIHQEQVRLTPVAAQAWWARAQEMGEEKWLLSRIHLVQAPEAVANDGVRSVATFLRIITAKYPDKLEALCSTILKDQPSRLGECLSAILASKIPTGRKIALLTERAISERFDQRAIAIGGLYQIDQGLFRKHLLLTLAQIHGRLNGKMPVDDVHVGTFVEFVKMANDQEAWDALATVVKRVDAGIRNSIISSLGPHDTRPDRKDPIRAERLRFLLRFLDDRTVEEYSTEGWTEGEIRAAYTEGQLEAFKGNIPKTYSWAEVRDIAAAQLAGLLGLTRLRSDNEYMAVYNPKAGPLSRLLTREAVRQAAMRELAQHRRGP